MKKSFWRRLIYTNCSTAWTFFNRLQIFLWKSVNTIYKTERRKSVFFGFLDKFSILYEALSFLSFTFQNNQQTINKNPFSGRILIFHHNKKSNANFAFRRLRENERFISPETRNRTPQPVSTLIHNRYYKTALSTRFQLKNCGTSLTRRPTISRDKSTESK